MPNYGSPATHARREVILEVVKRTGPIACGPLVNELLKLHRKGKWPKGPEGGRDDPYYTGVNQHLQALRAENKLMRSPHSDPGNRQVLYQHPDPEMLMPRGVDRTRVQSALDRYRHAYELEAVAGVTHDMRRVLRVQTGRGIVEHELDRHESWTEALRHAGLD